jgi:CBS domain-containing protein
MYIEQILARKGREVRTIEPTAAVSEALRRMRAERIGALVVLEDEARIAGILTDRRILNAIADQGPAMLEVPVTEVMTREVVTCSRRERVGEVMALMTERRIRYVPVVEEGGRLCGIVSIGDAVKHRLEEMRHEVDALREHIKSIL